VYLHIIEKQINIILFNDIYRNKILSSTDIPYCIDTILIIFPLYFKNTKKK